MKYFVFGLCLWLTLLLLPCCRSDKKNTKQEHSGFPPRFADMKWLLKTMNDTATYPYNKLLFQKKVSFFEALLKKPECRNNLEVNSAYANSLLEVGKSEEAADYYSAILQRIESGELKADSNQTSELSKMLAISYFRMAEQSNCITRHNPNSCILPFYSRAFHADSFGTLSAIRVLEQVIKTNPSDYQAKWLINIANSAIGRQSANLPLDWRIDFERYKSDFKTKPFRNVAENTCLDIPRHAGGAAVADFNNDGLLDVAVSSSDLFENVELFLSKGDGSFAKVTNESGLRGITGGINITHVDFNNDGNEDLYIMRGGWMEGYGNYPNSLLRNNGDGTFTDVTYKAGLLSFHPTHSACWGDFNNDGLLDLFVGHETSDSSDPHYSELYLNNGNETFTEVAKQSGITVNTFVKGTLWFDYNNDGLQDLYISNYLQPNILFRNNGNDKNGKVTFTDVSAQAGVQLPIASFPAFACDINNDGWEDLFVAVNNPQESDNNLFDEYKTGRAADHPPALYINQRNGTFKDRTLDYHLDRTISAMGINHGDIDNDGWEDFYVGTGNPDFRSLFPNLLFHNHAGQYFEDITMTTHTGHLQKGHGIAFADFDGDGDLDIFENMGGFFASDFYRSVLFENPGFSNNSVIVKLTGVGSNRNAIGARLTVSFNSGGTVHTVYKTISSGGSFGASPFDCLIGIQKATAISKLTITWSIGTVQTFTNLPANSSYNITEGKAEIKRIKVQRFKFR